MTQRQVEVWLFHPFGGSAYREIRRSVHLDCEARGWSLVLRPTARSRNSAGRPVDWIQREDAINLYRRVHRVRVGVWQIGDAFAPVKPQPRIFSKDYVPLRYFILHKAFHHNLLGPELGTHWTQSLGSFDEWLGQVNCEGEGDPRCLPFPVFNTGLKISNLGTKEGRSFFAKVHGPQSSRMDCGGLRWSRAKGPFHGRQVLHISGRDLVRGYHWDVSSHTSARRISTASETWEIDRKGYVNVYPDQHVRSGRRAKRILFRRSKQKPAVDSGL